MPHIASIELQILFCAILLGALQIVLVALASTIGGNLPWAVGPRDEPRDLGRYAERLNRAMKNFTETFVLFAAAVLLAHALGVKNKTTALGAQLYIWGRVAYVPLYAFGIPWLRTVAWTVAFVGILMVVGACWPH